jgi:prepilin-type N-terminal cleavage/methylation domain-containing protein
MLARTTQSPPGKPLRSGFTLIEVLIVMTIIGILAALILPAVNRARMRAQIARVQAELESIKASITDFNIRFKNNPPSSVTLYEAPAGWATDALSRRTIKTLWPQFDFSVSRDVNGDGDFTDTFAMEGSECLVFFLGGMIDGTSGAFRGFSKNPGNPLVLDNGTRDGPFFEFLGGIDPATKTPTGRITDSDGDSLPEYLDPLASQTQPIVYLSSNGGLGYRATDDDSINPYYRDGARRDPYHADGFQLISPGFDFAYGSGGPLETEDANGNGILDGDSTPNNGVFTEDLNDNGFLETSRSQMLTGLRQAEQDNITNFHTGQLRDGD